ncbi:MAG: hypothetical protein DWQ29_15550 [Planctomycetota bacterium]|nr:MAG: hypothetical protein DWQ29_15550 [Planctomycetota bacterium]
MTPMRCLLPLCVGLLLTPGLLPAADFTTNFNNIDDRTWIGPHFWANRLHDWRIGDGRVECIAAQPRLKLRTLQLLTHRLADEPGSFEITVQVGLLNDNVESVSESSAAGFLIGVGGADQDHRSAALIHGAHGRGGGCFFGITSRGQLVIRRNATSPEFEVVKQTVPEQLDLTAGATLRLQARSLSNGTYMVDLTVLPTRRGEYGEGLTWFSVQTTEAFGADFVGGIALASHPGSQQENKFGGRWWFDDLQLSGDRVESHPERGLGPIVSTMYTVSRSTMKMTAQFMPIAADAPRTAALQVEQADGAWHTVDEAEIEEPSYTALFRDDAWDASIEDNYRVVYPSGDDEAAHYHGTIRRDPIDKEKIVVAGFTGNHNNAHGFAREGYNFVQNIWFPHADITRAVAAHKPDLLFFSGDQVYEGDSPTFADTNPANIKLDYLYKWYLWCWAYRDLTKDIPTICIPDDHDIYQGNIWGQGGRKAVSPEPDRYTPNQPRDHDGGYVHPADFVAMVERTQTANLPDPYNTEPIDQGLTTYYTDLVWGQVGVAVLEDRKFKSGCNRTDMPPSGTGRPDHFNDPDFDVSDLDVEGATLLGEKQLQFIDEFAQDWDGQLMKMAVSQTIFANMATHHGRNLDRLIADLDSNGWPQSGRNRAVDALRKGFIFHLGGDQHLATIVHHGIEHHGDAIWSFCVPSVANFYPRAWAPELAGEYSWPPPETFTGPRYDGFGHPVTVYAATNPGRDMGHEPRELHDKMPGYGIVRLNKTERMITMECWPRSADPSRPGAKQYAGWPKTIRQSDNYAPKPVGYLADLKVIGVDSPVVQVVDADTGEVAWTLRILGNEYRDPAITDGEYRVIVRDGESSKTLENLKPLAAPKETRVRF